MTFPQLRSALFAGGLLAFALSFDEIIVTTFTAGSGVETLPIWILNNLFRPNQAPIVNVIAVVLVRGLDHPDLHRAAHRRRRAAAEVAAFGGREYAGSEHGSPVDRAERKLRGFDRRT